MGRFSTLRPESEKRSEFWRKNTLQAWGLLTDVNYDMMSGKGVFYENLVSKKDDLYPHLPLPNICLVYDHQDKIPCSISLSLAPQGNLIRVRASLFQSMVQWRDVAPENLETAVRNMVIWLIEKGMREFWFA